MQPLSAKLPPLKSTVAFEAAARHASLTLAAKELGVTREAVSRQIRILEEFLGVKVFTRLHRAIALTPAGEKLQTVVRKSLQDISYTVGQIRRPNAPYKITVSSTIATGSFWLTPRLAKFRAAFPNIEIHVAISDAPRDMLKEEIDIGLRYGDGKWPGLAAQKLFDISSFPVCTPEYLANSPPIETPGDLLDHALVNLDGSLHASEDWRWWLRGHGVKIPKAFKMLGFDSYDNVMQVAKDGQGIALGYSGLVTELVERGALVRPLDAELSNELAVYLVSPKTRELTSQVSEFMQWVLDEAAGTR
jgi:LysR family glycine cleavage system transcriptional activator